MSNQSPQHRPSTPSGLLESATEGMEEALMEADKKSPINSDPLAAPTDDELATADGEVLARALRSLVDQWWPLIKFPGQIPKGCTPLAIATIPDESSRILVACMRELVILVRKTPYAGVFPLSPDQSGEPKN